MPLSGNVLRITNQVTGGDPMVTLDLGSPQAEVWIEAVLQMPAATIASTIDDSYNPTGIQPHRDGGGTADDANLLIEERSGAARFVNFVNYPTEFGPSLLADTPYTVEIHIVFDPLTPGGGTGTETVEWYVNGTLVDSGSEPYDPLFATGIQTVDVGMLGTASDDSDIVAYFDSLTVGTTRHGTDLWDDDFTSGSLAAYTVNNPGFVEITDGPAAFESSWQVLLCDWKTDTELADLTDACVPTVKKRASRPTTVVLDMAADNPAIHEIWDDGDRKLVKGTRTLKVKIDDVLEAHVHVWDISYDSDENDGRLQVTGYDGMIRLLTRPLRDADGSFARPEFDVPISYADLIKQAIDNSVSNSGGAGDMEGFLPLDTAEGTFSTTVEMRDELTDWPITVADLVSLLTATGAVDVLCEPVDTSMGFDAGITGKVSAVDAAGTDRSGTVHYDYATGDFSIAKLRRRDSMETVCNKLWYYLGPKVATPADPDGDQHWRGNITATETGVAPGSENLSAYLTLEEASRDRYGTFMDIKVFDSTGSESTARPMFHELWRAEVAMRVDGRQMVYMTPAAGLEFLPIRSFDVFDIVALNVADIYGPAIEAGAQKVYGFDLTLDKDGVARCSELIVSPEDA